MQHAAFKMTLAIAVVSIVTPIVRSPRVSESRPSAGAVLDPDGKALYLKNCKQCHGVLGAPTRAGLNLDAKTPNFTLAAAFVGKSDTDLRTAVANGKGKNMAAFSDKLSAEEISAVVAYLRTLPKT